MVRLKDFWSFLHFYQQFGIYTSALHHYPSRSQLFKALMQTTCRNQDCLQSLVNSCFLIGYCRMGNGRSQRGKNNKQISCLQSRTQNIFHALWAPLEAASCLKNTLPKLSICLTWWKSECYFLLYCPYSTSTRIYFFAVPNWFHSSELRLWIIWHISCNSSDNSAQWKFQGPSLLTSRNINIWINCGF